MDPIFTPLLLAGAYFAKTQAAKSAAAAARKEAYCGKCGSELTYYRETKCCNTRYCPSCANTLSACTTCGTRIH